MSSVVGAGLVVRGEMLVMGDLTIEGRVEGPVLCETGAVTIAASGHLTGSIVARDITVFGTVDGTLVATEVVDIRPGSHVSGRVVAGRFVLAEDADFNGTSEPQHLEAALRVARHRHQIHHEAPAQPPPRRMPAVRSLSHH
jgi:cytoskeletal protein CcmA (bactofilin family)